MKVETVLFVLLQEIAQCLAISDFIDLSIIKNEG